MSMTPQGFYQNQHQPTYRIHSLQFLETGTYNDMYRRPYQTNVNMNTLAAFQEATRGGVNVGVNDVSSVAGELIHPAANVGSQDRIDMPNGWGEKRFLFMMEVIYPTHNSFDNGMGIRQLVSGYTDQPGVSNITGFKVRLDPQMRLFINSIVTLRRTMMMTPHGEQIMENVVDASQILSELHPPTIQGGYGVDPTMRGFTPDPNGWSQSHVNAPVTMRPEDVFHVNEVEMMPDHFGIVDTRHDFRQGVRKTHRQNNMAAEYVSKVAQAFQTSSTQNFEEGNRHEVMTHAAGLVKEPMIIRDKFLSLLTDRSAFGETGFVTYGELCRLQPDLDGITDVRYQDKRALIQSYSSNDSEGWAGAGMETVIATTLFQAVPAIMTSMMLARMTIVVTNRTLNGDFDIRPTEILGFKSMPIDEHIFNIFAMRLRTQVLANITQGNQIDIAFTLTIDVAGDSRLEISLNGQPFIPYVVPSFADARFTPVVANGYQALHHVAHDMSQLCDNLAVNYGTQRIQNTPGPGFVAQEVGRFAPEMATNIPNGVDYTSKV